ncbi:MAG: glycosyl transferase [Flavobacterium sp. BFFFF1]|uniref:glycosyltransferase family 4 protein n=1 Tax=unclassified Flavobacterium TaxID=196869 RepID=UPI000BD0902D|nr:MULTISPECIES: glycosyltransferase [unclassified Flavobacterium]OYU80814.1 MAG: glycosyl transferase [Flavobacterium sp. BFFFF1]
MSFLIITHVPHLVHKGKYYAYAPYVNEMNLWVNTVEKVTIAAPEDFSQEISPIQSAYEHEAIDFVKLRSFDLLSKRSIIGSMIKIPFLCLTLFSAMRKAEHIHLRCPGNVGLLGCLLQIFLPSKTKTAKYAGNWDPKSLQPWSYKLQRYILNNTFLTKNMTVLVYGEWPDSGKNIKPFFTATYRQEEIVPFTGKTPKIPIRFVFAGGLVAGKNPFYAIRLVEALHKNGKAVLLDLYGDGRLNEPIREYISQNGLQNQIIVHGNQNKQVLNAAYQRAHFVILPSDSEGWPKAIAEGMFWGCVPIATPVSCVPDMLNHGVRGLLLTSNLVNDTKAIRGLINDQEDFKAKSKAAAAWSRAYTIDLFETEIKKIIRT